MGAFIVQSTEAGRLQEISSLGNKKTGKVANEIDNVEIRTGRHSALIAEVKRNASTMTSNFSWGKLSKLRTKYNQTII